MFIFDLYWKHHRTFGKNESKENEVFKELEDRRYTNTVHSFVKFETYI